ncbi:phosphotidylinositol kinase Tel1, partial [Blumeria hordei DH14]
MVGAVPKLGSALINRRAEDFLRKSTSAINDKLFQKIFEALFKAITLEKHSYLKSKKSTRQLEIYAETIKLVVQAAIPFIKSKTVDTLVKNHIQVLAISEELIFQPLCKDVLKCLIIIFRHTPHIEHLKIVTWLETVDFCVQGINQYNKANRAESSVQKTSDQSRIKTRNNLSAISNEGSNSDLTRQNVEDLFQIIISLITTPNAPISERYAPIADCAIQFLLLQGSSISQVNQLVFFTLNRILHFTRTNHISFTKIAAQKLVPIIGQFLIRKTAAKDEMLNSVRDEMVILIFLVYSHIECTIKEEKCDEFSSQIGELLEIIKIDYSKRSERDQLQLNDLEMIDHSSIYTGSFGLYNFQLREHDIQAERNWSILLAIAILERINSLSLKIEPEKHSEKQHHPRKRQRICSILHYPINSIALNNEKEQTAGLQTLIFVLEITQLSCYELEVLLAELQLCSGSERDNVQAWALLAIASCTLQNSAKEICTKKWMQLWRVGMRYLTYTYTCRSASVALHSLLAQKLVLYQDVADDVDSIIRTVEHNGPVTLCDSSISLMVHLLKIRETEVPGADVATSEYILRWFFARWKPAERYFAAHYAIHVQPKHVSLLIRACLGLNHVSHAPIARPMGPIAQAWHSHLEEKLILDYLLLVEEKWPDARTTSNKMCSSCPEFTDLDNSNSISTTAKFQILQKLLLDLLNSLSISTLQGWDSYFVDHRPPISVEIYRSALYGCIAMLSTLSLCRINNLEKSGSLASSILKFARELVSSTGHPNRLASEESKKLAEILIQEIQPYLPPCQFVGISCMKDYVTELFQFFIAVAENFMKTPALGCETGSNDIKMIDLDEEPVPLLDIQPTKDNQNLKAMPRSCLALHASPGYIKMHTIGKLCLLTSMNAASHCTRALPGKFFDDIISLTDEEFLFSQKLLIDILDSDFDINIVDANRLVERIGLILSSDNLDRCEVTLTLCANMLSAMGPIWCRSRGSDLSKSATQIYEWITTTVIDKELASSEVQKRISKLLMSVLYSKPPDCELSDEPFSTLSPLFSILQRSEIRVKFFIADQIPKILGNFVLKDHDSVFADILDRLPSDADFIEGISLRMSVLTKIGSEWPTLLRRCIYHIFEIPSQISNSSEYATRCLNAISLKLELNSSKELFKLFSSQILYTWLEHESINDIPFQIFGFGSLQELVKLASEEATALMIMRGQDNSIQLLVNILQLDKIYLLQDSFTQAMAYSVAFDLSASNACPENPLGSESIMKASLGEKEYLHRIDYHFPEILAVMFDCLDQESTFEKYFQEGDLAYAANIMKRIKKFSTSNIVLPPNNQPVFKVKHLAAEIKFLCSRTKYKIETLFTPTIVTYVSRFLFDRIHPALGSLNVCSILRKIRVLISIAGSAVTTGYPLQMLLQSLGLFVQDPECADDVIGMIQYLLDVGSSYLLGVPSFVAGFSISMFGSLRQRRSSQRDESQDFQSQNSTCNSEKFYSWMTGYFQTYNSPLLSESNTKDTFQSLINAAINIQLAGSENMGIAESNLLFGLLSDENSSKGLLSRPSRDNALAMISSDFHGSVSSKADIINYDEGSIIYSPAIWKSCQNSTNKNYLAWVAKVLGRAFASSGCIHKDMLRESKLAQIKYFTALSGREGSSVEAILSFLNELTLGNNLQAISVAEKALRYVVAAADERLLITCKNIISDSLLTAITWFPYQPPPSETRDYSKLLLDISEFLTLESIFKQDWLSNFSIALSKLFPKEPVLAAMELVLSRIPWSAEQAFPFILHLVLTSYSSNTKFIRADLSSAINKWFQSDTTEQENLRILINAILYLRTQGLAGDFPSVDRTRWLEIDLYKSATAACSCGMFKTALLFIEEFYSKLSKSAPPTIGIRKELDPARDSAKLLLQIYENIDDPDLYYGVKQSANLDTILARLEHEKDGLKSLAFKGALFDNKIRKNNTASSNDLQSLIEVFDILNLSGVSNSLLQAFQSSGLPQSSIESLFRTSRKLGKWDIPVPSSYSSNSVSIYKVYQTINISPDLYSVKRAIDEGLGFTISKLIKKKPSTVELHETLQTMAALTEMDEVFESHGSENFEKLLARFQKRCSWMRVGSPILSCRGTTLGILSEKFELQKMMKLGLANCRLMEVKTALLSSNIYRSHGALQEVLSLATSMIDLIQPCQLVGINPEVAIHLEAAKTLWSQGELSSSIGMLQTLDQTTILDKQTIHIGRSDLLARIGHQISIARLENP